MINKGKFYDSETEMTSDDYPNCFLCGIGLDILGYVQIVITYCNVCNDCIKIYTVDKCD